MFINLSNHPVEQWDEGQKDAAVKLAGTIETIPFPVVPADADEYTVQKMADECVAIILDKERESRQQKENFAVMVQGEFTLTFAIVSSLTEKGICCVASCSTREKISSMNEKGENISVARFRFTRFRKYTR